MGNHLDTYYYSSNHTRLDQFIIFEALLFSKWFINIKQINLINWKWFEGKKLKLFIYITGFI